MFSALTAFSCLTWVSPVSYTHLDVYNRQELTIAYQLTDFFGALKIIPNMLALIWLAPQVVALNKEFYHTPGKYYMADMEAKQEKKAAKHSA